MKRVAQSIGEPTDRELSVSGLAALVLGNRSQHRAGLAEHTLLLAIGERRRALDGENGLDTGLGLLRVLPAGAAGS